MTEVDYRLTDRIADPESVAAPLHCEKLAYLPDTQWCFRPPVATPDVSELPALANAFVTFASFNAFHKLSPTTLQLFAEVLAAVPAARLLMFDVAPGRQSEYVAAVFAARGIERERLRLLPRSSIEVFYQTRCEVDIALDSFPYSGGTTTCESLWMGVPVVTMRGETSPSRSSASLLTACTLEYLIASNQVEYVRIARDLAADRAGLSRLRQALRQRMQASPIMDIERFVAGLEGVYQSLWAGRAGR
jgi:predicted O-linked N-acetylglucosamine transferase (SPINDLY family)